MPIDVPNSKPRMGFSELAPKVAAVGLNLADNPLTIVGIRGYYKDTMGQPGQNDAGIYDDAIFIVTPFLFASYNANTDPSKRRPGTGFGARKGMARLTPGVWRVYRFAQHDGPSTPPYDAICQRAGPVTVMRDGNPDYPHEGNFGINIHKGGFNTTSSEGCQTIYPDQWLEFIVSAQGQAQRIFGAHWKQTTIPYVLLSGI